MDIRRPSTDISFQKIRLSNTAGSLLPSLSVDKDLLSNSTEEERICSVIQVNQGKNRDQNLEQQIVEPNLKTQIVSSMPISAVLFHQETY